jgi:hypothetical protein
MKQDPSPTQVRAAFVGGMFAIMTAVISGAFLITNTLIQSGVITVSPGLRASQAGLNAWLDWLKSSPAPAESAQANDSPGKDRQAQEFSGSTLDTFVKGGSWLCLQGPVEVQNISQPVRFSGEKRPSMVCWIGPQQAQATGLSGAILQQASPGRGDLEEAVLALARSWSQELGEPVDFAVIRSDGSVFWP